MYTIVTTGTQLDAALRELGHVVVSVPVRTPGVHSARRVLDEAGVVPDIFIQSETLGSKILFNDLGTLDCLKVYWSIDTHLNYYWQRHYGALFDVFCTPHASYIGQLGPAWRHPQTLRLPIPARDLPWTPHGERAHEAVFVGRLTQFRPARQAFCDALRTRYGVEARDGLTHADMLALYAQSCVLPNECIAFETNFRLLEGASCGCCLITPDVGEDQDALFTPDAEMLVYRDMAECLWQMDRCRRDPALAERIGRAAYERVQREHLPVHRARALLDACTDASAARVAARGEAAENACWQALTLLHGNGQLRIDDVAAVVSRTVRNPATRAFCLLCDAIARQDAGGIQQCMAEAAAVCDAPTARTQPPCEDALALMTLCGGAALAAGDAALAHAWHSRHEHAQGRPTPPMPDTPAAACAAWADTLLREGKSLLHGLHYERGRHLSVQDMILLLTELEPFGSAWAEAMLADAHIVHTLPHLALTAWAQMTLRRENDMDASVRYIATALRLFDITQARREYDDVLHRLPEAARKSFERLLRARVPHWDVLADMP